MSRSRSTRQDRCGLLPLLHTAGGHRRCRAGNITGPLNASLPWQWPRSTHPASARSPDD
jgi:hypothetical protein